MTLPPHQPHPAMPAAGASPHALAANALHSVCVYCGSSPGVQPVYRDAARALGSLLAQRGLTLVYGGASIGVMGAVADAVLGAGGRVVGVIPHALAQREVAHAGLSELIVTPSMHVRKTRMAERADAFIALPGGIGTFEELFEIWTWAQLGIHAKPVGLLNVAGYFDALIALVDHVVQEGFLKPAQRTMLWVDTDPDRLLTRMAEGAAKGGADATTGARPLTLAQG